jgi:hypothetical protein
MLAENLKNMGRDVSPENLLYLYETYTGGPGKTVERLLNITAKLYNGDKIDANEVPIARRFYGKTFAQSFEMRNGHRQIIDNIDKQENTESAVANRVAYNLVQNLKDAPDIKSGFNSMLLEMQDNPQVNESVTRRVTELVKDYARGITTTDKQMQQLGVDSGARAKAYIEILKTMKPEEAATYIAEQKQKKILTDSVQKQLNAYAALKAQIGVK